MGTIYIRDVPESVSETLKKRAAESGTSLSSFLGAELARLAARPTNAQVAGRLRARDRASGPSREDILAALHESRR